MFKKHLKRLIRVIAPFGFYGWGNIGDEATLAGFAELLTNVESYLHVWIGSQNWRHTKKVEPAFDYFKAGGWDPRRWWAKWRADAQVVVGGAPVMDVLGDWPLCDVAPLVRQADFRWHVPFLFVGVGVETLRHHESRLLMEREIAPRVLHWSVRSERSGERLLEYGVAPARITVAADLAWLIPRQDRRFGRQRLCQWGLDDGRPVIGISLVNENALFDHHPEVADSVAATLDHWVEQFDAHLLFLSNEVRAGEGFDLAAAGRVVARLRHRDRAFVAPNDYFSPQQMMSIVGCCAFTLSMRFHFCIFSALQGVPFLAIERCDKLSDLCSDLRWKLSVKPLEPNFARLTEMGRMALDSGDFLRTSLGELAAEMRQRALRNLAPLQALGNAMKCSIPAATGTVG